MFLLKDSEIAKLINEPKPLPGNYLSLMKLRPKRGHSERDFDFQGVNGSEFRIIQRQSEFNVLDFTVILAYRPRESNTWFRLRRYNGRSHEHTNSIEEEKFYDFHIHRATERYQDLGAKEETYAQPSDKYNSLQEAIEFMFEECKFITPPEIPSAQGKMF